jgi:hypothetical protein
LPAFGINRDAMLHSCNTAGAGFAGAVQVALQKAGEWGSRKAGAVSFVRRIAGRMLDKMAGKGWQE